MSSLLSASQIPYLKAVNAIRANYITGCNNDDSICAVRARGLCWAEGMADSSEGHFHPTAHPGVLEAVRRLRKPRVIAWNFDGDAWCKGVEPEWRRDMFAVVTDNPQHQHIFLTKAYRLHHVSTEADPVHIALFRPNCWFGYSITQNEESTRWAEGPTFCNRWVSFEPILGPFNKEHIREGLEIVGVSFIVIGGLSDGNRRIIPPAEGGTRAEWIQPILDAAAEAGCRIYCKNLSGIWRDLVNPRTGKPMTGPRELRETPSEWTLPADPTPAAKGAMSDE